MQSKCPFANIFGAPGTGAHSIRLFGLAFVDVALTIAASYFIAIKTKKKFSPTLIKLVALGIVLHRVFGVNTALNEKIFKDKMDCLIK